MPKKYATTTTLVIVESPAKCKKIEQYLGPGYKVMASYGHLRELSSLKHIDFENNFSPTFTIIDNDMKRTQIEKLKKEINSAGEVILASDDDREGEAISWHICDMFKLNVEKTKRITFNEITESALKHAIKNPRTINMNIVHAQQTRQILDLKSQQCCGNVSHKNLNIPFLLEDVKRPRLKLFTTTKKKLMRVKWVEKRRCTIRLDILQIVTLRLI